MRGDIKFQIPGKTLHRAVEFKELLESLAFNVLRLEGYTIARHYVNGVFDGFFKIGA